MDQVFEPVMSIENSNCTDSLFQSGQYLISYTNNYIRASQNLIMNGVYKTAGETNRFENNNLYPASGVVITVSGFNSVANNECDNSNSGTCVGLD